MLFQINQAERIMSTLKQRYVWLLRHPRNSDIREHLPILYDLANKCSHITEFGTRDGISTTAFLYAPNVQTVVAYDIADCSLTVSELRDYLKESNRDVQFDFCQADVLTVEIAETDLLFIDTLHTKVQLEAELKLHADKARKWIVLHDTTTYGERGEVPNSRKFQGIGLWPAVVEFLEKNKVWFLLRRYENNNGLTILERKGV